jgi:hypothetical protein
LLDQIGIFLSIIGSVISVTGSLYNNLRHDHLAAMKIWGYGSNPILLVWAIGLSLHLWDGGVAGIPLVIMYGLFTLTNIYGLMKKD